MARSALGICALWLVVLVSACLRMVDEPPIWRCESSDDCSAGESCREGRCRPAGYCELSTECSELSICKSHACVEVECDTFRTEACGAYACNGNTCLFECSNESHCAPGLACADGECVEAECSDANEDVDCSGYVCDDGFCLTACADEFDCSENADCVTGECKPLLKTSEACDADAECESGLCCPQQAAETWACATSCELVPNGDTCQWDEICQSTVCGVTGVCTSSACEAVECGFHDYEYCGGCEGMNYCGDEFFCEPACVGLECGEDHGIDCGSCESNEFCGVQGICFSY